MYRDLSMLNGSDERILRISGKPLSSPVATVHSRSFFCVASCFFLFNQLSMMLLLGRLTAHSSCRQREVVARTCGSGLFYCLTFSVHSGCTMKRPNEKDSCGAQPSHNPELKALPCKGFAQQSRAERVLQSTHLEIQTGNLTFKPFHSVYASSLVVSMKICTLSEPVPRFRCINLPFVVCLVHGIRALVGDRWRCTGFRNRALTRR